MSKKDSDSQRSFMSFMYRGKEIFKPLNTGWIDERVATVREWVANVYFYTKNGKTIMIDAGYNYERLEEKMGWLDISPSSIEEILLTHLDTDHVGAVEKDSEGIFKRAKLYIGDIKVEAILVPGHTLGHLVYLIDDAYLFTGDTIWFGSDGGYSFLNSLAEDNALSIRSLERLEKLLQERGLSPKIISGHTGWTDDLEFAFRHRDKICNSMKKQKPHDPTAPYDGYDEREDTEERARGERLPKAWDYENL